MVLTRASGTVRASTLMRESFCWWLRVVEGLKVEAPACTWMNVRHQTPGYSLLNAHTPSTLTSNAGLCVCASLSPCILTPRHARTHTHTHRVGVRDGYADRNVVPQIGGELTVRLSADGCMARTHVLYARK